MPEALCSAIHQLLFRKVLLSPTILSQILPGDLGPGWGNVDHLAQ